MSRRLSFSQASCCAASRLRHSRRRCLLPQKPLRHRLRKRSSGRGQRRLRRIAAAQSRKIEATDAHGQLSGTGFFIDPNGTLYTCYSVGGETREIVVSTRRHASYPATRSSAIRAAASPFSRSEARPRFPAVGKSRELNLASPVMTIGYPMGLPATPSFGIVGGFDLTLSYAGCSPPRTSAPTFPCSAAKAARRCSICAVKSSA